MLRTQIYLPENLRQEIDAMARKEKKPAAYVKRVAERGYKQQTQRNSWNCLYQAGKSESQGRTF